MKKEKYNLTEVLKKSSTMEKTLLGGILSCEDRLKTIGIGVFITETLVLINLFLLISFISKF